MKKTILIGLTILFISLNFIDIDINKIEPYDQKEEFDPRLSYLNSIDKLENYIDSTIKTRAIEPSSVEYVATISKAIRYRFYHGFSHFTLKENWIAAVGEKIFGYGLASKVKPEDIMHLPYAACSQQALVMMEILKRKHIDYRGVGFPHHFALEASINGQWCYFDPNMEPQISNIQRPESQWGSKADNLKQYYDTSRFKDLDWKFGTKLDVTHGDVNQKYARHVKIFHTVTGIFSKILWIFPLFLLVYKKK